jgi:hypothetical protein
LSRTPILGSLELISGARDLLRMDEPGSIGLWPRAAAAVGRQGLETALDELWELRCPGLEETNTRCQLICLPVLLQDDELAGRASHAWYSLTRLCHYAGEVVPLPSEVEGWLIDAWDFANAVERLTA